MLIKPLQIGNLGDFVRIVTDQLQFIGQERRMVSCVNAGYQALAIPAKIMKVFADSQRSRARQGGDRLSWCLAVGPSQEAAGTSG